MKIIVDAMGGDNAPGEIISGTLDAVAEYGINAVLVGQGERILETFKEKGIREIPLGVEIAHAPDMILMDDNPSAVVKEKPDSSLVRAVLMLARENGDALVSAGSTGAILAASTLYVKRIRGIRRAALAPFLPAKKGSPLLIDCGANVECSPEYLLQFAFMGSIYAKKQRSIANPRVGLLNIGTERTKGTALHREAYSLLERAGNNGLIHFIGNIESRGVAFGEADVIVADGFGGNIMLKTMEGVGQFFAAMLKDMFMSGAKSKLAALLVKKEIGDFKKTLDYSETGGSPLLGLNKPVIKAHGSSNALAIKNAIRQAKVFVESGVIEEIKMNIENMKTSSGEERIND